MTARKPKLRHVVLLIETSRAYGRGLVEGVGRYVEEHGPWSIYFEERSLLDPLPRWLKDWQGDGLITRTTRKTDLEMLLAKRLPTVELFAEPDGRFSTVTPDRSAVANMAVEHFFDRGFRNFAFFCTDDLWWMQLRQNDFERELLRREYECRLFPARERRPAKNDQEAMREIADWLDALPKPCGVFCASDLYAARLLAACRRKGIAVPEEIAVLGVDNDSVMCSVSFPPLSSIELGSRRIGYEAAALLDRLMASKKAKQEIVCVQPEAIIGRQSTDTLAIENGDVAQAICFIREHACAGLDVGQVVEASGLSRRTLEQRFQQTLCRTPKQEILRIQMDRAKKLLAETDMSVEMVCHRSGFGSFKYFARVFRRMTDVAPREYRRRQRIVTQHDS
jgi:LacI family transcriptional regulator